MQLHNQLIFKMLGLFKAQTVNRTSQTFRNTSVY